MSILKTGYENGKKVQRTNPYTLKPKNHHAFGLKIMLAERTPNTSSAEGVIDRTFVINNHKGSPKLDIKEIITPSSKSIERQDLLFLRKVLLVYRLLHYNHNFIIYKQV